MACETAKTSQPFESRDHLFGTIETERVDTQDCAPYSSVRTTQGRWDSFLGSLLISMVRGVDADEQGRLYDPEGSKLERGDRQKVI